MSRNIGQKKRFEVLQRDGFACKYCGQKAPFVQLEVDHIVPRSNGGTNEITNLTTACFNCNRGKGNREMGYKLDSVSLINDRCKSDKARLYKKRNDMKLGTIEDRNKVLMAVYFDNSYDAGPYLSWRSSSIDIFHKNIDEFSKCGDLFYSVLDEMSNDILERVYLIIETVQGSNNKNNTLNYLLTEGLNEYDIDFNVLRRFSLFPKLITNG